MLLEGPDIRTLLAQVREEHGPDARIVHAERVRSGGVGGFFAKQRFEVTVEIDGAAAGTASTPDQLAEQFASSAGGDSFTPSSRPTPRPAVTASTDRIEPIDAAAPVTHVRALGAVSRGEAALAAEPLPWGPAAAGGAAVDALIAAMDKAGADAVELGDRRVPSMVPSALTDPFVPSRLPVEPILPILEEATRAAGVDPRPALTPVGPLTVAAAEPTPLGDLVGWLSTQQAALAEAGTARTGAPAPTAPRAPGVDPEVLAGIVARAGLVATGEQPAPAAFAVPQPMPVAAAPVTPIADAVSRDRSMATVTPLPGVETPMQAAAPKAPRRPGDVLVLVGEVGPAFETARTLAASLRIPTERVRVVSHAPVAGLAEEQRVSDVLEARLAGAQLAMERTPGIVVVDAPLALVADAHGCDWVDDVVAALDPTAVWAVVDATRRHEDLVRWLGVLPQLEALAVHGVAVTSAPEAVHHLGVPVSLVDGRAVPEPGPTHTPEPTARRRSS